MNPDRLVLRLAAVSALNNFMQAPYPTIAGPQVFDSRIEPVEDFKEDVVFPVCVVYTDYDKDHWQHHSTTNRERLLTVTFELLLAQIKEQPDDVGGQSVFVIRYPNTDSELETSLDIFELQLERAFSLDNPAAVCWRHLVQRHVNVISRRGATVEGGQKLAARQVTVEAVLPRGPANGNIASAVAAFLDELELHDDFKDRVPAIRELYTSASAMTAAEQMLRVMGWSDITGEKLGYQRGPQPILPTNVIWVGTP